MLGKGPGLSAAASRLEGLWQNTTTGNTSFGNKQRAENKHASFMFQPFNVQRKVLYYQKQ